MAIFGKDGAKQGSHNGSTIISAGTKLAGDLCLSDDLHVDGRIEGDVFSEAGVVIGAEGGLSGRIEASSVVVSGSVDGSIKAGRLEIIAGGSVKGEVHTAELVIEPGGRFNGSSEDLSEHGETARKAAGTAEGHGNRKENRGGSDSDAASVAAGPASA